MTEIDHNLAVELLSPIGRFSSRGVRLILRNLNVAGLADAIDVFGFRAAILQSLNKDAYKDAALKKKLRLLNHKDAAELFVRATIIDKLKNINQDNENI